MNQSVLNWDCDYMHKLICIPFNVEVDELQMFDIMIEFNKEGVSV